MLGLCQDNVTHVLAKGRVGLVDAALVRWLRRQKASVQRLLVQVTDSIFAPLMPQEHIEEFLAALEDVNEVLGDEASEVMLGSRASAPVIPLPEHELLRYTLIQICKREPAGEEVSRLLQSTETRVLPAHGHSGQAGGPLNRDSFQQARMACKLASLEELRQRYDPLPRQRAITVGIVSGSFDLIHPGHVRIMQAAKQRVDILVVLTMSTESIQRQEKNRLGDRPIYAQRDRVEVLSALRPVDHVVLFDDLDCRPSLQGFCPDYYFKTSLDRSRATVQAEATVVESLGGQTIYLPDHHPGYSSTAIILHVRHQLSHGHPTRGTVDA